jgi:hypothetical protein
MPMAEAQDAEELRVFRLFADAAQLDVAPGSIRKRQPPEPDIQCEVRDQGLTYFELVEIVDAKLARAEADQRTWQQRLSDAAQSSVLRNLGNALVYVSFARNTAAAQKSGVIPGLMALLRQLPADYQGDVALSGHVNAIVRRVRVRRGDFVGPCFQVDAATFITDPVVEQIEGKLKKNYAMNRRLELLAFYELHPTHRAEFELPAVEDCVRNNLQGSQFSRVWIFDVENRTVLYRSS